MYLSNLEISNFRNYKSLRFELKPGLNIFIGENAQGKTNLLESIYFLSCGSSYRTAENKEAILWDEYRYHFERYQRILNQRNSLLKLFHLTNNRKKVLSTLDLWNRLLATSGSFIIIKRIKLIEILNNLARGVIDRIPANGKLEICYGTSISAEKEDKIKDIESELLRKLKERQKRDTSIGVTTIGPHRDDIKITIGGRDVRHYGSGGQQRMIALSLKFAELNFYDEKLGKKAILLLDELLSELDENKRRALLKIAQDVEQTIITSTHYPQLLKTKKSKISTYLVENGKIKVWQ